MKNLFQIGIIFIKTRGWSVLLGSLLSACLISLHAKPEFNGIALPESERARTIMEAGWCTFHYPYDPVIRDRQLFPLTTFTKNLNFGSYGSSSESISAVSPDVERVNQYLRRMGCAMRLRRQNSPNAEGETSPYPLYVALILDIVATLKGSATTTTITDSITQKQYDGICLNEHFKSFCDQEGRQHRVIMQTRHPSRTICLAQLSEKPKDFAEVFRFIAQLKSESTIPSGYAQVRMPMFCINYQADLQWVNFTASNTNPPYLVAQAKQQVTFSLDEKGVTLKSAVTRDAVPECASIPLTFDRPFLVWVEQRENAESDPIVIAAFYVDNTFWKSIKKGSDS